MLEPMANMPLNSKEFSSSGFRVSSLGFRDESGRLGVEGVGLRDEREKFRVESVTLTVESAGFLVQGLKFGV